MVKDKIIQAFRILISPQKEFQALKLRSLESVAAHHTVLLLMSGLFAFSATILFYILRGVYYGVFFNADILYLRVLNYSFGIGIALFYLFLFGGTFGLFFLAAIIKPFFGKLKFTELIKIILYSATPVLVFAWLPLSQYMLFIWGMFLFVVGIKEALSNVK